jgi:hypothetical protein
VEHHWLCPDILDCSLLVRAVMDCSHLVRAVMDCSLLVRAATTGPDQG